MKLIFGLSFGKGQLNIVFLQIAPAHCIQQKLKDLAKAFSDAFDKNQPLKQIPRKKKKNIGDSFRFPEPKHIEINNRRIKLPKIGWIGFVKSQSINGNIKNVTVSKEANYWYIAIQVEEKLMPKLKFANSSIGIDLGVTTFAALSSGLAVKYPKSSKWEKLLIKVQQKIAKKKKFSQNWKKLVTKLQSIHSKIAHIRKDFLHKLSTQLSKSHALIVMEDLQIKNMSKSAKGSLAEPGRNVKAKSGLNKSILAQGWGEFKRQLAYKLAWAGGMLITVAPHKTSQKCHGCGYTAKDNRLTQAQFNCQSCGLKLNADINAAKNILAAGHAVLACGEIGLPNSVKQEPLGMGDLVPA